MGAGSKANASTGDPCDNTAARTRKPGSDSRVPSAASLHAIGSGDAMLGAVLARMEEGDRFEEACRWGAAAGAVNASKLEVCDFTREAVAGLLPETRLKKLGR